MRKGDFGLICCECRETAKRAFRPRIEFVKEFSSEYDFVNSEQKYYKESQKYYIQKDSWNHGF